VSSLRANYKISSSIVKKHAVRRGKTDNKTADIFHESVIKTMMGDNNQKEIIM